MISVFQCAKTGFTTLFRPYSGKVSGKHGNFLYHPRSFADRVSRYFLSVCTTPRTRPSAMPWWRARNGWRCEPFREETNTGRRPTIGFMLYQRLRRWHNMEPTLGRRLLQVGSWGPIEWVTTDDLPALYNLAVTCWWTGETFPSTLGSHQAQSGVKFATLSNKTFM